MAMHRAQAGAHLLVEVVVQEAADEQVEQGLLAVLIMPQHRQLMQRQQLAAHQVQVSVGVSLKLLLLLLLSVTGACSTATN